MENDLTRKMLWRSIYDCVRDCKIPALEYLHLVLNELPFEQDTDLLETNLYYSRVCSSAMVGEQLRETQTTNLFQMVLERVMTENSQPIVAILVSNLVQLAITRQQRELLIQWINDGNAKNSEGEQMVMVKLTREDRYLLIRSLYSDKDFPTQIRERMLQKELDEDKSDEGIRAKNSCHAAVSDPLNKAKLWEKYLSSDNQESEKLLVSSMKGFWHWSQKDILKPYVDKFFQNVRN